LFVRERLQREFLGGAAAVAAAVTDTVTTPLPGLGYGRVADAAAAATWVALRFLS
jgi:hypothetical protein